MTKPTNDAFAVNMDLILQVVSQNTEAVSELSKTMSDMRVSMKGVEGKVEAQNQIVERLTASIEEMKIVGKDVQELRGQFNIHENSGMESRKRINERLDGQEKHITEIEKLANSAKTTAKTADDKSKIDLTKIGVQLFVYVFGGGGGLAFFVWLFENYLKKP